MRKDEVRSPSGALAYLVDCQLATVCDLAGKRSHSKGDLRRHISIAQSGVDWMSEFRVNLDGTRADEVVFMHAGSVEAWAKKFIHNDA